MQLPVSASAARAKLPMREQEQCGCAPPSAVDPAHAERRPSVLRSRRPARAVANLLSPVVHRPPVHRPPSTVYRPPSTIEPTEPPSHRASAERAHVWLCCGVRRPPSAQSQSHSPCIPAALSAISAHSRHRILLPFPSRTLLTCPSCSPPPQLRPGLMFAPL
ncbi:hypothetical protein P171DRAFT_524258 [Karstenula rhodostoma CBS 690.94]|uniref:Uncharacterized protein n=1 Tax=Karstenula rhodostoma CBS 690.94 TaxID=1392251 RepID=A0A9P4U9Q5_9PLEO|nr:hypothetical protein P171DRAFT_524258 [Karstenula rhodostoma CBS 690.94]